MQLSVEHSIRHTTCLQCPRLCFANAKCRESGLSILDHTYGKPCPINRFGACSRPPEPIDPDYVPTPENAIKGGCGCAK